MAGVDVFLDFDAEGLFDGSLSLLRGMGTAGGIHTGQLALPGL